MYITSNKERNTVKDEDEMQRTLKWKLRLDGYKGVKPILWASYSFVEISEGGIRSIERKLVQVRKNKDAIIALTSWEGVGPKDKEILRSFYRTTLLAERSMVQTIEDVGRIIVLKKEIDQTEQLSLGEQKS